MDTRQATSLAGSEQPLTVLALVLRCNTTVQTYPATSSTINARLGDKLTRELVEMRRGLREKFGVPKERVDEIERPLRHYPVEPEPETG